MKITGKELADLKKARDLLEKDSIAIRAANLFGDAAEWCVRCFPEMYQKRVETYSVMAVEKSYEFSETTLALIPESQEQHRNYAIISGAIGGVGILTLFVELPVTTVIMIRSVADIARKEGFDCKQYETRMSCLESFALGGEAVDRDKGESGYYLSRSLLGKPLEESGRYIAKKGLAGMGAPFTAQVLAKLAARYQTFVSVKAASAAVPVAGAVVGAAINILFINYFREKAQGHFIVRGLEKKYGCEEVKHEYESIHLKALLPIEVPEEETDKIIRHHVWASAGVAMIPLPLADFAGLTVIQLNLIRKLADRFNVPFLKGAVKNILSAIVGSAVPATVSSPLAASLMKFFPIAGQGIGVATMPVIAGASTYAVGKVFVQHFASGGTFLTFDPKKVRAYYSEMFEEGKEIAGDGENLARDMEQ